MSHSYNVEYTDTFAGEANYSWVRRHVVTMPELTHYGYDGSTNYAKSNRIYQRELVKRAKAATGLTGVRGTGHWQGEDYTFVPYRSTTTMFISWRDE